MLDLCVECGIEYVYPPNRVCFECRTRKELDEMARELGVPTLEEANRAILRGETTRSEAIKVAREANLRNLCNPLKT